MSMSDANGSDKSVPGIGPRFSIGAPASGSMNE